MRIRRVTVAARKASAVDAGLQSADDGNDVVFSDDTIAALSLPPASVVVFAQDQASWLEELLPDLLSQDYPAGFEIIVVNEGASDATRDLVEHLAMSHPNLYLTYTPDGARNLSRKKLGLTIGIKAATNPVVVNISAASRVPSERWLRSIMAPFADKETEVALGYAAPSDGDNSYGRRRRAYDYAADTVTWLSSALAGKPYRGTEYNLAYTRDIFFRNKGFSRSLNLVNGDDDIFVNEIATGDNTAVVLSPDSMVIANFRDHRMAHEDLRRRHSFTGHRLPAAPRRLMYLSSWVLLATLVAATVAVAMFPYNVIALAAAVVIILTALTSVCVAWRNVMRALNLRPVCLTAPYLTIMRPWRRLSLAFRSRGSRTRNYTWNK